MHMNMAMKSWNIRVNSETEIKVRTTHIIHLLRVASSEKRTKLPSCEAGIGNLMWKPTWLPLLFVYLPIATKTSPGYRARSPSRSTSQIISSNSFPIPKVIPKCWVNKGCNMLFFISCLNVVKTIVKIIRRPQSGNIINIIINEIPRNSFAALFPKRILRPYWGVIFSQKHF